MPFGSEGLEDLTGLAVSGGGFHATLFHLGALWRLNEVGWLPKLDRISSVSGGSITTGLLAVRWGRLQFSNGEATNFAEEIVAPLRKFCGRPIDTPAIVEGALVPWRDVSEVIDREYKEHLFGQTRLDQLPDRPRFIFNATNFMSGVNLRFSKPYAGDYRIGLIRNPRFTVALAVTASSAFPPFLSPVIRAVDPTTFERSEGADLYDDMKYRERFVLTDGGAYDNLALETLEKRCRTLLVGDAGAPFHLSADPPTAWHAQALRAFDVATSQARGLRKRRLLADYVEKLRQGTYWGIVTEIAGYGLPDALSVSLEATRYLSSMRTPLNTFSDEEQARLINGGYALCDAAMRKYVLSEAPAKAPQWPYPQHSLDRPISVEEAAAAAVGSIEAP